MILVAPDAYWERIKTTTSEETIEEGTGATRLYTWGIGWEMFLYNPIIGVGQGNFPWAFEEYQGDRTFQEKSYAGRAAHSLYFTLLPELGLAGLFIFLGMLIHSFKDLRWVSELAVEYPKANRTQVKMVETAEDVQKRNRVGSALFLARAIEAGFIGYLVASIFVSTLYYPTFWVLMAFSVALRNCVANEVESEGKQREYALGARSLGQVRRSTFSSRAKEEFRPS